MSEAEYEWPLDERRGWLEVTHSDGEIHRLWWNGSKWSEGPFAPWQLLTAQLIERGYLGVRREPADAEPAFFWPREDEPGDYDVTHEDGEVRPAWFNGKRWAEDQNSPWLVSTEQMIERGWLGVRSEPATLQQGPQPIVPVTDTSIAANLSVIPPTPKTLTPDPDDGNAMVAQEALDEWRLIQHKPAEVERWAYRWAVELCERLGAR
jgi:hypothetical protein